MRKIHTSPLGVARREKINKKARFWRVIPLAIGIDKLRSFVISEVEYRLLPII